MTKYQKECIKITKQLLSSKSPKIKEGFLEKIMKETKEVKLIMIMKDVRDAI